MLQSAKEMLEILGRFLDKASWLVRGLAFDGHGAHNYFRECLFGEFQRLNPEILQNMTFWKDIQYRDLPRNVFPKLNFKLAEYQGDSIWPLCGPCLLATAMFGNFELWLFMIIYVYL